jgi:hypothetical protein
MSYLQSPITGYEKIYTILHTPVFPVHRVDNAGKGAVFYLYPDCPAVGRTARQGPEQRHHLPGLYPTRHIWLYRLSLVEE